MTHRGGHHLDPHPVVLDDLATVTSPDHVEGTRLASEAFRRAGVRHVLIGGLAVGMHGHPRQTRDIDFLVGDEAFDHHGPIVTPRPNLPIRYKNIDIDWVSLEERERAALEEFLVMPGEGEIPVMDSIPLAAMKLCAGRQKDKADVVELIKAGLDLRRIRDFVAERFPARTRMLEELIQLAAEES